MDGNKLKSWVCIGAYCHDERQKALYCQVSDPSCLHQAPPGTFMVFSTYGPAAARGTDRDTDSWWGGGGGGGALTEYEC